MFLYKLAEDYTPLCLLYITGYFVSFNYYIILWYCEHSQNRKMKIIAFAWFQALVMYIFLFLFSTCIYIFIYVCRYMILYTHKNVPKNNSSVFYLFQASDKEKKIILKLLSGDQLGHIFFLYIFKVCIYERRQRWLLK